MKIGSHKAVNVIYLRRFLLSLLFCSALGQLGGQCWLGCCRGDGSPHRCGPSDSVSHWPAAGFINSWLLFLWAIFSSPLYPRVITPPFLPWGFPPRLVIPSVGAPHWPFIPYQNPACLCPMVEVARAQNQDAKNLVSNHFTSCGTSGHHTFSRVSVY